MWTRAAVYVGIVLGLCVILRLLSLRLHKVYRLFSAFLAVEVTSELALAISTRLPMDYRLCWIVLAIPGWILTLWTVYALLDAILAKLPGVLSLSQFVLRLGFLIAAAVACAVVLETPHLGPQVHGAFEEAILAGIQIERAVGVLALLALLAIEGFVLWFPVEMPRNLFAFTAGLTVYFLFRTATVLSIAFLPPHAQARLAQITMIVLPACYVYWIVSIHRSGEASQVRVGQSWAGSNNQELALLELERMNTALLRSVKS